ncbi:bifunctional phosphoribosylaminoimidazolecarboxamide formyltransferase/IMP cyclohydrolase, partial [Candidatus Sumerlaeota bacterium]|nr:bifunctional phosphoribosylaminoimidazolecarboxamide formyltransferase/IMP cyclohydrolase [Candidatus Sumerlaeota bacterium]
PSLLRAAAKNHHHLYPVVDPADYPEVLRVLGDGREADGRAFRRKLAVKVFEHCSKYDCAIASYMARAAEEADQEKSALPGRLDLSWPARQHLRYGENPHQAAAFYADPGCAAPSLAHCKQLQGKELSYNNYLDGDAALEMAREFEEPAAVILKHANPCGVGRGATLAGAYKNALACDPVSAFGGIVGLNRPMDAKTAEAMAELFLEVVIAPSYEAGALAIFAKKKNLRLLEAGPLTPRRTGMSYRTVSGGILAQETDIALTPREAMKVVTKAQPAESDWDALLFAWKVVRWVRSNAIVYASRERTLGIGAGQMSRIDAARFGIEKAEAQSPGCLKGAYLASDGFFPFRDVVDLAAKAGVKALIQPGGSVRDDESVTAADEHGLVMVITGQRHFRH